jgi:hypothetical protein
VCTPGTAAVPKRTASGWRSSRIRPSRPGRSVSRWAATSRTARVWNPRSSSRPTRDPPPLMAGCFLEGSAESLVERLASRSRGTRLAASCRPLSSSVRARRRPLDRLLDNAPETC